MTKVLTLDQILLNTRKHGGRMTPLVLQYCDRSVRKKYCTVKLLQLTRSPHKVGPIAYGEYLTAIREKIIPSSMPFSQFYQFGILPDIYSVRIIHSILGNSLKTHPTATNIWLCQVLSTVLETIDRYPRQQL